MKITKKGVLKKTKAVFSAGRVLFIVLVLMVILAPFMVKAGSYILTAISGPTGNSGNPITDISRFSQLGPIFPYLMFFFCWFMMYLTVLSGWMLIFLVIPTMREAIGNGIKNLVKDIKS
ncbi:MAG: hypothetical protein WC242_03620 [Candidatus Paceibacterota bacterium]|jgi:hypothetical protein